MDPPTIWFFLYRVALRLKERGRKRGLTNRQTESNEKSNNYDIQGKRHVIKWDRLNRETDTKLSNEGKYEDRHK